MHSRSPGGDINKTPRLVETATRRVSGQGDVGTARGSKTDLLQQTVEQRAAQTVALVCGEGGHVGDEEVPAPVANNAPHGDGFPLGAYGVTKRP